MKDVCYITGADGGLKPVSRAVFEKHRAERQKEAGKHPGRRWRLKIDPLRRGSPIQLDSTGAVPSFFDELVIDHWFHLEAMTDRSWFIALGDWQIWCRVTRSGKVRVNYLEGRPRATKRGAS